MSVTRAATLLRETSVPLKGSSLWVTSAVLVERRCLHHVPPPPRQVDVRASGYLTRVEQARNCAKWLLRTPPANQNILLPTRMQCRADR